MGSFTLYWQVHLCLGCRYSFVFIPNKAVLSDVFEYNKGKNLYVAFGVTVKFSKVIKELA